MDTSPAPDAQLSNGFGWSLVRPDLAKFLLGVAWHDIGASGNPGAVQHAIAGVFGTALACPFDRLERLTS